MKLNGYKVELYVPGEFDDDIEFFLENIKQEDVDEIYASGDDDVREALMTSLEMSEEAFFIRDYTDELILIFGITFFEHPEYGRGGWLLTTEKTKLIKRDFLINTDIVIKEILKKYKRFHNYVSVKNKPSLRWLKWLGAKFSEPVIVEKTGEEFVIFILEEGD